MGHIEYFNNEERCKELLKELRHWKGTLFQYSTNGKAYPKISADCVSFPINIFKRMGLIAMDFDTPPYCSRPTGIYELKKIYKGMDEQIPGLECVWKREEFEWNPKNVKCGDILVCSTGRATHHLLIAESDKYGWDCWPGAGVRKTELCQKQIVRRVKRLYRFFEI